LVTVISSHPARIDRVPLGIAYMLGASVMFACCSAISKWQVVTYPVAEVLAFRAIGSLLTVAALILPYAGLGVFRTKRLRDHAGRNFTQFIAQSCIIVAFSMMPLAGATAITFSSPLFATLAASFWLHEKVGLTRGIALAVGFGGVVMVAAPGADTFSIGALYALANAVLYGSVTAAVRGMTKTESAETLTMYQMVFLTVFFSLALLYTGFIVPTPLDFAGLALNGVLNGFGQFWWTRSLSMAPTAAVGPFYYFLLIWTLILGFAFWGDVPGLSLIAGSVVVVGSGLYLLWHESGKKQLPPEEPL